MAPTVGALADISRVDDLGHHDGVHRLMAHALRDPREAIAALATDRGRSVQAMERHAPPGRSLPSSGRSGRMRAFLAVLKKELRVTFVSPLAWVFLVAFLFLAGLFFYLGVATTGAASLRTMMANLSIALLFLLPMLTMRHFAEESRNGTLELMMTAPVPLWSLILGKWASSVIRVHCFCSAPACFLGSRVLRRARLGRHHDQLPRADAVLHDLLLGRNLQLEPDGWPVAGGLWV